MKPSQAHIKGFPEWLPEGRMVEQHLLDMVRQQYELHGFTPLETSAVEKMDSLVGQGDTSKEIYVLRRLQAGEDEADTQMGLHFDLTVPFARFVMQNRGALPMPFRRYQIQKAWRGESPAYGRFREFYQADLDIVNEGDLPVAADAEIIQTLFDVTSALPIPSIGLRINNRKVLEGLFRGVGITDITGTLRTVDKLDKIGPEAVTEILTQEIGVSLAAAKICLKAAEIKSNDLDFVHQVQALNIEHPLLDEGLNELKFVMTAMDVHAQGKVMVDLSIARGLDYYTGTVCEGKMAGFEEHGSVCSGGRYDNLVSGLGAKQKMPGVGASIGVTRILSFLFDQDMYMIDRKTPSCILVALDAEETRLTSLQVAHQLRERGIACEVSMFANPYGKQIKEANRKGIPFVWFPNAQSDDGHKVKNIRSGDQVAADPTTWMPPADLLRAQITLAGLSRSRQ